MVTHGRGRPADRSRPRTAQDDPPREGGFAYVLLSHVDPEAVLRSVRRIRELSPTAHVLVRHAQGPGFLDEVHAAAAGAEVLVSRTAIRWGTFSTVAAVLEALAEAERRWQPSHTVVVSGQDHPVRDLQAWEDGVRRTGADGLLRQDHRRYDERHTYRWHALPEALGRWRPLLAAAARATRNDPVRRLVHVQEAGERTWVVAHARRSRPPVPYRKGTLWMTLSHRAVARLLTVDERTRRFFATTLIPDEAFVHSVLAATPGLRVVDGVTSVAFFPPQGGPHPRTVLAEDVPAVLTTGAAFARKVVAGHSDEFVRLVDAAVDAERTRTTPAATAVVERTAP
ncbi:beta-1,6-N-acetylglucosaminyltransferase [Kineosporiaceae bacterium B12]|nr:beta-1,6-N-acetylglucosaminyltransferase [Kineococcus rubinsiae]